MATTNFMTTTNIRFPIFKDAKRTNIPYCIEVNENKKEVYFIDRNYNYMGYNTKSFRDIREDTDGFERYYVFNDGSKPWYERHGGGGTEYQSKKNYLNAINKVLEICKGKNVMWYDSNLITKRIEYNDLIEKIKSTICPKTQEKYKKKLNELLCVYKEECLKNI